MYGSTDDLLFCPGENNCDKFKGAKGSSRAAKEKNACTNCDLFATKTDSTQTGHRSMIRLVDRAFYARSRNRAGYPIPLDRIDNLVFQTMLEVEETVEIYEIYLKKEATATILAAAGLKKG